MLIQRCVSSRSVHIIVTEFLLDLKRRDFNQPAPQKWNDNQMLIFDSFERMSGYTYFGIIDHDEFLIPSLNRSLKQMLVSLFFFILLQKYTYAQTFKTSEILRLLSYAHYDKSWLCSLSSLLII